MNMRYTFKTTVTLLTVLFMLPVQMIWADTWDGTSKTKPSGAGTADSPYIISKAAEFAWFGDQMGNNTTYFVLTADIDLNNKVWTKGGNSGATFKGHFDGQGHTVSNVSITTVSGKNNGLFCNISGSSATARAEVKNLKIRNVTFTPTTVAAANTKVGAIAGYTKWVDITNVQVSGVSFTVNGDVTGAVYIAGAVGHVENGQSLMKGVTVENATLTVNGNSGSTLYLSGLFGYVNGQKDQLVNVFNCKVENPTLSLTGNVTSTTYIGGAIGMTTNYTAVDGLYIDGGSITGPTETKTITNNKEFWVGGAVAKQNSSGVNLNQPNYIHNVAVSGMTIDFGKYEAAGVINNHKFGVGGVIGTVNAPNDDKNGRRGMPENLLFKGGKIYAPHAATSPTVANFGATIASYNNYTGENYTSNIDCIEKSKAGTWLYSDYQLGLSPEFLAYEKIDNWNAAPAQNRWRKNFEDAKLAAADASGVRYLSVNDETFKRQNRRLDNERPSKTVLWWTNQANYNETTGAAVALFTENEQPIYPQSNFGTVGQAELTKFPYYMYFYQGVANAKYVKAADADEIIKGIEANIAEAEKTTVVGKTPLTLTLTDNKIKYSDVPESKDVRGFDMHTLTVTPSYDAAVDSYKWYVDGVGQDGATTNTFSLKPDWKTGKSIIVNAIKGGNVVASVGYALRVGVLKTKNGDTEEVGSDIFGRGTKDNPYIIDSPEALRQWSMLSTMNSSQIWEGLVKPTATTNTGGVANQVQGHYNRAYYELGADIDLNNEPFTPISHIGTSGDGTDGTYTNNWIFQGNFDGKGHKISNINITWSAGNINGNNSNQYWGLFGALGHSILTAKWGDGTATSNTVVRNLVIDGATFTHDTNNKTFYYGNGSITTTNSNRAMVGVLAGIVNSNTTVENIEIRNSKITDEGSSDYDLAAQGLYVGGAIGSMQYAFGTESTMPINMTVWNIVADVDITLTHPVFHNVEKPAEVGAFNIGGIIGRIIATSQATTVQPIMPSYTFFKGTVYAPKAWISPVIGAVRYSNQQGVNVANYIKQWEGNNGTAETQHTVTNAAYYKYFITVDGVSKLITENYPADECPLGSRTVKKHIDGSYSEPKELQGVNYSAKYISSEKAPFDVESGKILAVGMLNDGLARQGVTEFTWVWNETEDMPSIRMGIVSSQDYAYLTRGTDTDLNSLRIATSYVNATYKWQKYNSSTHGWEDIADVATYAYIAIPSKSTDEYYRAVVTENKTEHVTQAVQVKFVPMHSNFRINLAAATDNNVYSIEVTGDQVNTSNQTMTTQWYKADGATLFTEGVDAMNHTLTLTDAIKSENKKIFCHVTVTDNDKTIISQIVSYYNVGKVVYLMLNTDNTNTSVNASNGMTYTYKVTDKSQPDWGRTPDNPANTWVDAYSLLDEYTPAAITKGGYNNAQVMIDDSKNLVTVDDNIIVVMGLAKNNYFDNNNGVDGTVASKPVTVTGKWDGVDYHGCICNTSDNLSLNADHKFENIGFSISTSGRLRMYAHRWNVHMGKGILMGYEAGLAAGKDDANNYKINYADASTGTPVGHRAADIAVMGGYLNDGTSNNPEKNEYVNHGRKEGQIIRLESGLWGPVCPGNRQTGECVSYYIMGGPDNPAKTTIIIDIDQAWNDEHRQYKKGEFATLDVGCLLTGNHEGTMYADVVLDILSGRMGRVVNGIKGSQRVVGANNGFKTGGNYRHIVRNIDSNGDPVSGSGIGSTTGSGTKWLYTSAPPPDSYLGRGIINISPAKAVNYTSAGSMNDRVSVVELYCGGLGRCHNDGYFHPEVATNFFGQSIVNIEGGTFQNTIYGAGAGGVNGIGTDAHHTDDNGIPFYPGGVKDAVWYASYEYLQESGNLGNIASVSYHNNEPMQDRSGATMPTDGTVDLRDTYTFINITGGVFGSEASPVSIYAGGSGETNDALINMVDAPATTDIKNSVQTPNHQAGCIFGNGEGVASEIRIKNATIYGNIYGGGKGSAKYYRWISLTPATTPDNITSRSNYATTAFQDYTRMSQPANYATYLVAYVKKLRSKADNYLKLGQVYGDTKITLGDNAVIHGNVFGGGEGVADMTREDFIAGTGMTLTLDNANLNISNMTAARTDKNFNTPNIAHKYYISFPDMGKVFGKAQVNIGSNAVVHGNVYGGGDAGSIQGVKDAGGNVVGNPVMAESSEVNISDMAEIYGSVFGAGRGLTIDNAANYRDVATIAGNTHVNLRGGTIWQNVYGGGENAVVNGNTNFNMSAGSIAANAYGGGMGNVKTVEIASTPTTVITRADIAGNTNVNITGGKIVWDRSSLSGEQEVDVTIYNYTRNVAAENVTGEEYESSTDDTAEKVQTTYTVQGYTGVTATAQTTPTKEVDGTIYYLWNVNYTIPAHTETASFDYKANPEGYTSAGTTTEKRKLVAGQVINWNISDPSSAYYANFYYEAGGKFNIEHNIFGGGYLACNVGTYDNEGRSADGTGKATVNMTRGLFGMDLMNTRQWQTAYNDNEHPHFYVFGGGYGVHTKVAETDVDVNIQYGDGSVETDEQLARPRRTVADPGQTEVMPIISDAYGQSNATVLGVLGGGYNGWVGATDVLIDGDTYCHRVYGGGLGSYDGWVEAGRPTTIGAMTDATGYVGITDETRIEIAGGNIYGAVFGGGAGVAPFDEDDDDAANDDHTQFTDFTEIARTKGATHVIVADNANIFGRVYGGGDVANVGRAGVPAHDDVPEVPATESRVEVVGGNVYGDVFGGGSGRKKGAAMDYTTIGKVEGNTVVAISKTSGTPAIVPNLFGDIYGGCAFGTVAGDALVTVDGGNIGRNIFGGGLGDVAEGGAVTSADIGGTTTVNVNGGVCMWDKTADTSGNIRTFDRSLFYRGTATDFTPVEAFYNDSTQLFRIDHNIYGGGNVASRVLGTATLNVNHGLLDDVMLLNNYSKDYLEGRRNIPLAWWCYYSIIDQVQHPQFSVLGGGYGENTSVASTSVNVEVGNRQGEVKDYAEKESDNQKWIASETAMYIDWGNVTTSDKNTLYGGENHNAYRRYRSTRLAWASGVPSHTFINIVGGGFAGSVDGNTRVNIDNYTCARNVFGGGIGVVDGEPTGDETSGQVHGNAVVAIGGGVISQNVYGGGAGVPSVMDGEGAYVDFPAVAQVLGTTTVMIDGEAEGLAPESEDKVDQTVIFGHVYGGGDVASVGTKPDETPAYTTGAYDNGNYAASVTIKGGLVFSQIHGGGKGRTAAVCGDYTKLGAIYGNTSVNILPHHAVLTDGVWSNSSDDKTLETWLWNRIYGGGENGTVYGSTNVNIQGGNIGYNIFGGGWGNLDASPETDDDRRISYADVKGNTHVNINTIEGACAEFCISQIWQTGTVRAWAPVNYKKDGDETPYSPQYNPDTQNFIVNHNIYGGGNVACRVDGTAYVTMTRGMISKNSTVISGSTTPLFNTNEWRESYNKHAAPHFSVFGGGYGPDTHVNTSDVNIAISGDVETKSLIERGEESYTNFASYQSLVDVVGGGYNGSVDDCNLTIGGRTFMRNAFGGAYYATTRTATTNIVSCNLDNIYGGGMMGDVADAVTVNVGKAADDPAYSAANNQAIHILQDIYGANDVSGNIGGEGSTINLLGGHVYGNVYAGGNGNYLYAVDGDLDQKSTTVVAHEDSLVNGKKRLVFSVPMREAFGGYKSSNEVQRILNIATFRPVIGKTQINMQGNQTPVVADVNLDTKDFLLVDGAVFGGGNSATVANFAGVGEPSSQLNIGSNIKVGSIFLGNDGEAMFKDEASNNFITDFPTLNNITLADSIDWTAPEQQDISTEYFPTAKEDRPVIYKTLLDLYFVSVEMNFIPTVKWGLQTVDGRLQGKNAGNAETVSTSDFNNVFVGTFCCGANRGNMTTADHVDLVFPEGLTITNKIVGGCNDANYILGEGTGSETMHVGGYLKGTHQLLYADGSAARRDDLQPQIKLKMKNRFLIQTDASDNYLESANVYGGCYSSGNVRGDIEINMCSDMLRGYEIPKMRQAFETTPNSRSVASVYGGGYGTNTYVYGDTRVTLGSGVPYTNESQASVYNLFGGGQQGNVIGNSNVQVANGHVGGNVVGGSYAGYLYGSTNVAVGYPRVYICQKSGTYTLLRKDDDAAHLALVDADGNEYIKQEIYLLKGDGISAAVLDEVTHWDKTDITSVKTTSEYFVQVADYYRPEDYNLKWTDVNIVVDKAIYGGGYSLASGSSVGAGAKTVRKYTDDFNMDDFAQGVYGVGSTIGYGGNTTVMICDLTPNNVNTRNEFKSAHDTADAADETANCNVDHITLSTGTFNKVTTKTGDPLFGLYYHNGVSWVYVNNPDATFPYKGHVGGQEDKTPEQIATDAAAIKYYNYIGEGGMFGDGHLSLSEGFRFGEITRYGFAGSAPNGAKLMNCIHRFDIARVKDCCMSLMGDRDYVTSSTGGTDTEPYAIARVGELQLKSDMAADAALNAKRDENVLIYTARRARNYIGLSSNVRNLGCLFSDVDMSSTRHQADGSLDAGSRSYQTYKTDTIAESYDYNTYEPYQDKQTKFAMRNDGTAHNLIGIASGMALVIQDAARASKSEPETPFYGPLKGVIEVSLINIIPGEAGGYVYAQNKHNVSPTGFGFLQLEGNVVYPIVESGRKVVDECFPHNYGHCTHTSPSPSRAHRTVGVPGDPDDAEGHYWYVTGYNYYFNTTISAYTSNPTPIDPMREFQMKYARGFVKLTGFDPNRTWKDGTKDGVKYNNEIKIKSIRFLPHADVENCDIQKKFLGNNAYEALNLAGYDLKLMIAPTETYYEPGQAGAVYVDRVREVSEELSPWETSAVEGLGAEPCVAISLFDNVENNGIDVDEEHRTYFEKYLSQPCKMEIVLEVPDLIYGKDGYTDQESDNYKPVEETYKYTINLTIQYVQGPNYVGYVDASCALPGEMVRLSKKNLRIITDDNSMPKNGEKWEFGPLNAGGTDITPVGGLTYTITGENGTPGAELTGAYIDKTNDEIIIPAYYFMHGYGVRYSFKVSGLDDEFPVAINLDKSVLNIHNYHRMKSGSPQGIQSVVDLKIRKAAERALAEADEPPAYGSALPLPRVYIEDADDLARFRDYVRVQSGAVTDNGAGVDFHLMTDLAVPSGFASGLTFAGNLHGNGHLLSGNTLFDNNTGNIYNLGMSAATIAAASTGKLQNCYAYGANLLGTKGGTLTNCYTSVKGADEDAQQGTYATDAEFRYGKVAYDLNSHYVGKRESDTESAYVNAIYGNGDYLYATHNGNGAEFLRTSVAVHYGSTDSYHNTAHTVDEARATYYTEDDIEHGIHARDFKEYRPLLDAAKHNSKANLSVLKNDYLFFGQRMRYDAAMKIPNAITPASHIVDDMTNRVRRAYGYMRHKLTGFNATTENTDPGFYFNKDAYVYNPALTAVNFCKASETDMNIDMPSALTSFSVVDVVDTAKVTRNLLVYSNVADNTSTVFKEGVYNDTKLESAIAYHTINDGTPKTIANLHLVERQPGDGTYCNDFNAPIEFNVTNRAWYTRRPLAYSFGNSAWEGICLPFLVNKVEAADNGEITHFYDDKQDYTKDQVNLGKTGHEYWLRTLDKVETVNAETRATFVAPSPVADTTDPENVAYPQGSYSYTNNYYADTYGDDYTHNKYGTELTYANYAFQQANTPYIVSFPGKKYYEFDLSNEFYNEWFAGKAPAKSSQSVTFSHYTTHDGVSADAKGFATIGVTDDVRSAVETPMVHTANGYSHVGVFQSLKADANNGYLAIGNTTKRGDSFISESVMDADGPGAMTREIAPFRTYMTADPTPDYAPHRIMIAEATRSVVEIPFEGDRDGKPEDGLQSDITFSIDRLLVTVTSTCDAVTPLSVFNSAGQLICIHNATTGTSQFTLPGEGIYIIGKKKVWARVRY